MAKQIIDDTVMENIEILAKLALTCEKRNLLPIRFLWKMCSGKTL